MEQSSTHRGTRPTRPQSEPLYSTVVIHGGDSDSDSDHDRTYRKSQPHPQKQDLYATMVYKDSEENEDEDEDDDSSLPPLLKRLPKDFGGGASIDYDNDYGESSKTEDFGTMIVKTDRSLNDRSSSSSYYYSYTSSKPQSSPISDYESAKRAMGRHDDVDDEDGDEDEEEEDEGDGERNSTFVVKKSERGKSVKGLGDSTMGRAVASMQAAGELEFVKQRKASAASEQGGEEGRNLAMRNISTSSIPESVVMREDPSTKYELLNELGKSSILILQLRSGYDVCGKGSYGVVYKARDIRTLELVAVKVISLSEGDEGYDEICGEIETLQRCSHPNVVRYLGSYQGEEYLWIVMEYCGGGSVVDLMNVTEEPLEENQIAYICREALKGLAYLHSISKVHRDIKGGNILLTEQGDVKLGE
ncbi:mitogen-activated protein kinase kinase kinase kinase 5 [Quercus suber]|uniref:Mitogen-activated protein kinase kinase kinase kinase 5 n=1 Tax=Quercus suber TaxID=58331 RepID=A0AAW0LJX8_QUESU